MYVLSYFREKLAILIFAGKFHLESFPQFYHIKAIKLGCVVSQHCLLYLNNKWVILLYYNRVIYSNTIKNLPSFISNRKTHKKLILFSYFISIYTDRIMQINVHINNNVCKSYNNQFYCWKRLDACKTLPSCWFYFPFSLKVFTHHHCFSSNQIALLLGSGRF